MAVPRFVVACLHTINPLRADLRLVWPLRAPTLRQISFPAVLSRLLFKQARTVHAHAEIIFSSRPGNCSGGRAGVERSQRGAWRGREAGGADGDTEQSLRSEQRATAGKAGGGAAAAGVSILVRVGGDAPAGSAQDQAGASILARVAVFVVERARPELAPAV